MYRSSPFRSTLNRGYITCLGMCKVCTEAVHSVALCPAKKAQTPKHGPGKKDRNRARGVFQGRRTSRSAGICISWIRPRHSLPVGSWRLIKGPLIKIVMICFPTVTLSVRQISGSCQHIFRRGLLQASSVFWGLQWWLAVHRDFVML